MSRQGGARRGSDSRKDGERMTVLHNVARSLVSMVRSSGIRKDYMIDDDHGKRTRPQFTFEYAAQLLSWLSPARFIRRKQANLALQRSEWVAC
jgi:hypothetical protein